MTQPTIESRVASAILERPTGTLKINGQVYKVAPPTLATLILVSEIVSTLPIVEHTDDPNKRMDLVLHHARNYKALGDIAAVLILGAKTIRDEEQKTSKARRWYSFLRRKKKNMSRREALAKAILENISPRTLFDIIVTRLKEQEVGFFFLITTSLSEANLLKPTKET